MRKIMFGDKFGLTQAVLEDRKTMTRRIINPQPTYSELKGVLWKGGYYGVGFDNPKDAYKNFVSGTEHDKSCNRYHVGDVVAIAQSYESIGRKDIAWEYKTNDDGSAIESVMLPGWKNKMFVRSEYMSWAIKITDVRVEKLRDITEDDCLKEGIVTYSKDGFVFKYDLSDGFEMFSWQTMKRTPKEAFAALINKVSGKGTWDSNPWVFVYSFEVIPNPNIKK